LREAVTMPIARSLLVAVAALALAACASPPRPTEPDALGFERVIVAPLNLTVRTPEELAGKGDPVWDELLHALEARSEKIAFIAPASARALWIEATGDLDLSDRSRALRTARSRFARLLATHRAYDALVVPSLVLRAARVWGWQASWDGVQRSALGPFESMGSGGLGHGQSSMSPSNVTGVLSGASLHVAVLDSEGQLLYEGLGGLALAQTPRRRETLGGWTFEPRPEPFADRDQVREGIGIALATSDPSR
jgi:hypothetical protein